MSDEKIENALTEEEWANLRADPHSSHEAVAAYLSNSYHFGADEANDAARIIAAMNDRLPDSDPRKITREMVNTLRDISRKIGADYGAPSESKGELDEIADALASYLPPET